MVRKLLFVLVILLAVLAACEAGSWLLYLALTGKPFSWHEMATRRAGLTDAETPLVHHRDLDLPGDLGLYVVHPFLGYVLDRDRMGKSDPHGFLSVEPAQGRDGVIQEPLYLDVLGGSVALNFVLKGGTAHLVDELRRRGVLGPRPVAVRCLALGGFKQPQQLMALNYFLALGERPDAVLNIDGFNEVALSWCNHRHGVYPHFPRDWHLRTRTLPNLEDQRTAGAMVLLRRSRSLRAQLFSRWPLRTSVVANLLWSTSDKVLRQRLAALSMRMNDPYPSDRSYLSHGPHEEARSDHAFFAEVASVWQHSSLQIDQLCRANGIRYYHFLQPNQYLEGAKLLSREEQRTAINRDHPYRHGVVAGYPRLQDAGRELARQGVSFTDLSMVFADVPDTLYIDDCCHFNQLGNEIMAEAIADAIVAQLEEEADS
jgi:hypothetical protein